MAPKKTVIWNLRSACGAVSRDVEALQAAVFFSWLRSSDAPPSVLHSHDTRSFRNVCFR